MEATQHDKIAEREAEETVRGWPDGRVGQVVRLLATRWKVVAEKPSEVRLSAKAM